MPRLTISRPRTPLGFPAQRRVWFSLAFMLSLITACQSQPARTITPVTITAIAEPSAASSEAPVATASGETTQPDSTAVSDNSARPTREQVEQQALAVDVYQPGDPAKCALGAVAAPADLSANVQVFFGCTPPTGPVVSAVAARQVAVPTGSDPKEAAIRALLEGPTEEERGAGYLANFGPASQNVDFTIEMLDNGLAVVDFDAAIRGVQFIFVSDMDATQIVATLGQFPEVKRVTILIDGKLLCQVTEEC